jgi:HSP20 family molecular chaperone IbpA
MTEEVKTIEKDVPRYTPATDILEMDDGFHIYMDMPGVAKEDLEIDLKDNEVTIRGMSEYKQQDTGNRLHSEFEAAEYARTFTLSDVVDRARIKAVLKNGVLDLHLPKAEEAKPRKIEIKAE